MASPGFSWLAIGFALLVVGVRASSGACDFVSTAYASCDSACDIPKGGVTQFRLRGECCENVSEVDPVKLWLTRSSMFLCPCSGDVLDLDCVLLHEVRTVLASRPFTCTGSVDRVPEYITFMKYKCEGAIRRADNDHVIVHQGKK
jgi:hypothetical protein